MRSILIKTITAEELGNSDLPEPNFIIPGILPMGLTVMAGKPKTYKSMFSLYTCISVATGKTLFDHIEVQSRGVLYIALEDTAYRVKSRSMKMLGEIPPPDNLHFAFDWPAIGTGFVREIKKFLEEHDDIKLIVVDTLARVSGSTRLGSNYQANYDLISKIKRLADLCQIAILVVHHAKKGQTKDILDGVLGSTGITAAADNIMLMSRSKTHSGPFLHIEGRDVEQAELALDFDQDNGMFSLAGPAEEYLMSPERREVFEVMQRADRSMKLKEIAEALGKKGPVVHKLLAGLIEQGLVEQPGHGSYQIVGKSVETGEQGEQHENGNPLEKLNLKQENASDTREGSAETGFPSPDEQDGSFEEVEEEIDPELLMEFEEIMSGSATRPGKDNQGISEAGMESIQ